jgi:hypothetical protein
MSLEWTEVLDRLLRIVESTYPHKWVSARLADASDAIAPRSMVTLFWAAAKHALTEGPKAHFLRLLTPGEMKQGLRETSQRRVAELAEEHPVVERLSLIRQQKLPLNVERAAELLGQVPSDTDGFGASGDVVLEELVELGVAMRAGKDRTRQERIDIPDIYRLHFQIGRVGHKVTV